MAFEGSISQPWHMLITIMRDCGPDCISTCVPREEAAKTTAAGFSLTSACGLQGTFRKVKPYDIAQAWHLGSWFFFSFQSNFCTVFNLLVVFQVLTSWKSHAKENWHGRNLPIPAPAKSIGAGVVGIHTSLLPVPSTKALYPGVVSDRVLDEHFVLLDGGQDVSAGHRISLLF